MAALKLTVAGPVIIAQLVIVFLPENTQIESRE